MNILILEDEKLVINKIKNKIKKIFSLNKNKIIINLVYLKLKRNKNWYIIWSNKIKLKWFDFILIDRDNEFWENFHNIFFDLLNKNIKNKFVKNYNDIIKLSNSLYLISGSHKNNLYFIEQYIKFLIKYWFIKNFEQQKYIENILNKNIYTKSIWYKFNELLNLIKNY